MTNVTTKPKIIFLVVARHQIPSMPVIQFSSHETFTQLTRQLYMLENEHTNISSRSTLCFWLEAVKGVVTGEMCGRWDWF